MAESWLLISYPSSHSSLSSFSSSCFNVVSLFLLRPLLALSFVLTILLIGWTLAWKLVLVHVPLVQEMFGLRKKAKKERPAINRRFSRFYDSVKEARNQPPPSSPSPSPSTLRTPENRK